MYKVNILLSTYNGECYLEEQLDSIFNQTYKNYTIFIMDDFSVDHTEDILKRYQKEYPNKIEILTTNKKLGYPDCFWYILENCAMADFYAFCDQDDIWDPQKLEFMVRQMAKTSKDVPVLYFHEYDNCDSELNLLDHHSVEPIEKYKGYQLIFYAIAQGFSMAINNTMRSLVLEQKVQNKKLSHDRWLIWNAYFRGKIVYDSHVLAKYRRHEKSVTSSGQQLFRQIISWLKKEIMGDEMLLLEKRIDYFLTINKEYMDANEYKTWCVFGRDSIIKGRYFKKLFFRKRLRKSLGGELALRILFLLGK